MTIATAMKLTPIVAPSKRIHTSVLTLDVGNAKLTHHSRNTVDTTRPVKPLPISEADNRLTQHLDVTCTVPCAGCRTTLLRVSTLKRHFSDCTELKTKRIIVEHTEAIKQMKAQMDIESKRASHEARRALQGRKRCHQLESNNSKPRKKSRSEKCSRALFPISQTFASSHVVDHNHNEFRSTDATEHQTQMHISSGLSSAPGVIPNTISEPSYLIDSRRISQNNATIGKGASEITNETIGRAAMYFANSQHSTVPSTDAATRSGFFETTNEAAMCSHNEPPAAHNHSSAANVLNTYIANNQHSAANSTAQAIRGSSFMSYTMDGSFMYPDDQYPISQGAMTTKRGSSFISNTMDGSFMYPDDPTRTAQNIAIERLESWRST